ncbi:MAG: hypothetical protein AAFQ41_02395 [Cyanobacteria bacterium J06623_7]
MVRLLKKTQQKQKVSLLSILAIATLSLHILTLALLILQGLSIRQLYLRKPPTFVQLINGKKVDNIKDLERDPDVIQQFVSKVSILMFNWSGKLPPQTIKDVSQPTPDLGISIATEQGSSEKVSTSSWMASFALSEDFRPAFLREIASITPREIFSNIPREAISAQLIIKRIDRPEEIAPGKWRVRMVANLIQKKTNTNRQVIIPYNKDFLIRAVDYFSHPLASNASNLQQAIYNIRSDRLEIYEIRDLCLLDENNKQDAHDLQHCRTLQLEG